jgi:hypothetical protein
MVRKKITTGYVVQTFDPNGVLRHQEFIAGDQIDWTDDFDNPCDPIENAYHPFDMFQPNDPEESCGI